MKALLITTSGLLLTLLMEIAILAFHPAQHAAACTPPPTPTVERLPTIAQRTETANVVVLGTVTAVRGPEVHSRIATVKVESYLKGDEGPEQIEISGFGSRGICLSPIQVGGSYIIFADGDPFSPTLRAHYSPWRDSSSETTGLRGQGNATAAPSTENIQIVLTVVSEGDSAPADGTLPLTGDSQVGELAKLAFALGAVVLLGGGIVLLLRRPRSTF